MVDVLNDSENQSLIQLLWVGCVEIKIVWKQIKSLTSKKCGDLGRNFEESNLEILTKTKISLE